MHCILRNAIFFRTEPKEKKSLTRYVEYIGFGQEEERGKRGNEVNMASLPDAPVVRIGQFTIRFIRVNSSFIHSI